jgi:hypothetical protein
MATRVLLLPADCPERRQTVRTEGKTAWRPRTVARGSRSAEDDRETETVSFTGAGPYRFAGLHHLLCVRADHLGKLDYTPTGKSPSWWLRPHQVRNHHLDRWRQRGPPTGEKRDRERTSEAVHASKSARAGADTPDTPDTRDTFKETRAGSGGQASPAATLRVEL